MKVASWNVNSLKVRLPQVLAWLESRQPDVLGLQETKLADDRFPERAFRDAGWHVAYSGQKTYNGVALVTRHPLEDPVTDLEPAGDTQRRIIGGTVGNVRVCNVYVPNGQEVGSDKFDYKLSWLERLRERVAEELSRHADFIVIGDFNIAPADADVHDPQELAGTIHCSEPERAALQRLLETGLVDTFRLFDQPAGAFSWWDYRAAAFRRNRGLRIDLILASTALSARCASSTIEVDPRRQERPSDHAPIVAEFA